MSIAIAELQQSVTSPLWQQAEAMHITRKGRELVTDKFPLAIIVAEELEKQCAGPHIRRARNHLVFRLANGHARYELVERRPGFSLWRREFELPVVAPSAAPLFAEDTESE